MLGVGCSQVLTSIDQAIQDGRTVLIETASPSFAINDCVSVLSEIVLGTEFEKEGNIYTGPLKSENCYGQEKVNRLNKWATHNKITLSVQSAWSDHFSDFDMLILAEKHYWVGGEQLRKLLMDRNPEANFVHTEQWVAESDGKFLDIYSSKSLRLQYPVS